MTTSSTTTRAPSGDSAFSGSIPQLYERYLVPLFFEPHAADLARRVAQLRPDRVLEVAAGTGVVTRHLDQVLPPKSLIVATDLNQAMLDQAKATPTAWRRAVDWRQADAMALPFPDAAFDVVVCQFGVMFFPDKPKAFAEAKRVLRPGGRLLFSVWDRIEHNEAADTVDRAMQSHFPDDPPRFLARTPYAYHDRARIEADLAAGGFHKALQWETVSHAGHAASPHHAALAVCGGTPLLVEITARVGDRVTDATRAATDALTTRFGAGPLSPQTRAHVIAVMA